MSIDLFKVTALSDQYGPYAQVADASGRVLWKSGPTIIAFTMPGRQMQAVKGMTFAEWCDSEYNDGEFYIHSSGKLYSHAAFWMVLDGVAVMGTDEVKEGATYEYYDSWG